MQYYICKDYEGKLKYASVKNRWICRNELHSVTFSGFISLSDYFCDLFSVSQDLCDSYKISRGFFLFIIHRTEETLKRIGLDGKVLETK